MLKPLATSAVAVLLGAVTVPSVLAATTSSTVAGGAADSVPTRRPVEAGAEIADSTPLVRLAPAVEVDDPAEVRLDPTVVVSGADDAQLALVDDALASFRDAGLLLPDMDVVFHDDPAECRGHDGLFQAQHTPWRLLVCSDLAFVVTHEMAHAWEAANLDDDDRRAYTEFRGMATWDDSAADWADRAVEDAAFMIQQNLMAGNVRLDRPGWAERTAAFEALTGRRSPVLPPAIPGLR